LWEERPHFTDSGRWTQHAIARIRYNATVAEQNATSLSASRIELRQDQIRIRHKAVDALREPRPHQRRLDCLTPL
jgi:hypothetical protein